MLAGTENTLSALFQTEISARILAATGQPPQSPNILDLLGDAIAFSVIPHFLAVTLVGGGTLTGVGGLI